MFLWELSDLDAEGKMAGPKDVDDTVVEEPGVEAQLLDLSGKLSGGVMGLQTAGKLSYNLNQ